MQKSSIGLKQSSWFIEIGKQTWELLESSQTPQKQLSQLQKQKLYSQCFFNYSPVKIPKLKEYLVKELDLNSNRADIFINAFTKFLKKKQDACVNEFKNLQNQINQIKQEGGSKTLQYLIRIKFAQSSQKRYSSFFNLNVSKQHQIPTLQQIIKKAKKYNTKFLSKTLEKLNQISSSNLQSKYDLYETWKQALNEIEVLNVQKIMNLFSKYNQKDNDFSEKDKIIFIIGPSGIGKTTFSIVMGGHQVQPITQSGKTYYVAKDPLIRQKFKTSHLDSQTTIPGIMRKKDVVFIDCGGFFDRRSQQIDILNNLINQKLASNIKHMRIVIMIAQKMLGLRGSGLHTIAQAISKYFQNYQQVKNNITIVVNCFNTKSIAQIKDYVALTSQKILNGEGNYNQNYQQFIFHLDQILKKQANYVKFDPQNYSQNLMLGKILKSVQLQDPKTIIKVSFSQESRRKIKQQAQYYSKMIQETYNNRQFEQFRFYMAKLKTLQDKIARKINNQCNYMQEAIKFINEKNSSIVQSYSKQLSLFLESNKNEYLNNLIQMKKNIVQISSLQLQNIKTPKKDIDDIETLKSRKIVEYFAYLQRGNTSSSNNQNKSITLINAQLRFLKLVNQQKFNLIKLRLKDAKQSLKFQFKQLLKNSKIAAQFQRFFNKFQQISVIDEQNLDKTNSLQKNSSQICEWIKVQFIQIYFQKLDDILKDAKKIKIDTESIEKFFFKLQLMKGMSPVIQNMLEKQKTEYEKKLNQLLFDYVQLLKKLQCNVSRLKLFRIYRNNYQELMKVQAIKQKNSISKLKFTDTIQTFIQNQSENIQSQKIKIINLLNYSYNQNILIEHQSVMKIIKNIIKLMNFMIALQNEKDDQFNSKQIKQSIKQSNSHIISLIQAIRNRIADQKVQRFEFNLYLLNLFIVASQLNQIHKQFKKNKKQQKTDSDMKKMQTQKNSPCSQQVNIVKIINVQTYKQKIQEIETVVIQKINEPLIQLTNLINEKYDLKNKIQQLKNQSQKSESIQVPKIQKDEKNIKKKNSGIKKQSPQLITESNFQNLKHLFLYFQQLGKKKRSIVQNDSSNCNLQRFQNQSSPEFSKCIQILFKQIKSRFSQLSQCYKHEQFDSERSENSKQIRQLQYSYQKKSRIYLKSYEQIIIICDKFNKIKIVNDFKKDFLQLYNLKYYIESRIRKIIDQYKAGKYQGDYNQINQILNEFGNITRIYSRAYKISVEDKKQYQQTVQNLRKSKENINKKFNTKIEQIQCNISKKQLIQLDYIKKYLKQTCLNQKSNKNQIGQLIKSLQVLITQKIDPFFNTSGAIASKDIEAMKLLRYVDQFLQFVENQIESKSDLKGICQCKLKKDDQRLQKISDQLFTILKKQVEKEKEKCQKNLYLSDIQVWSQLKHKSDLYKFHLSKRFLVFCQTNKQLLDIQKTQLDLKTSIENVLIDKKYFDKNQKLNVDENLIKIYVTLKGSNKEILDQKINKKIEQEKQIIQKKKETNIQQFHAQKSNLKEIKKLFPKQFKDKIQDFIKEVQKQFTNQQQKKLQNIKKNKSSRNIQKIIKNLQQSKEKKNMELFKIIVQEIVSFLQNDINSFNLESEIKTGEIAKTVKQCMIKYPQKIESNKNTKQQNQIVKQISNLKQKYNVEATSYIISLNSKILQYLKEFTKKNNDQGTLLKNISIKAVSQIKSFLKSYKSVIQFIEQNKDIYEKYDYKQILGLLKKVCQKFAQSQTKFFDNLNKKDYQEYLIRANIFKLFTIEFTAILDSIKTKIDLTVSQMSKYVTQSNKIERQCQQIYKRISNNLQSFKQISLTIQNLQRMLLIKNFQVNWKNLDEQAKINSNYEYVYNSFKNSQENFTKFYVDTKNKLQTQFDSLESQIINIIRENFKCNEVKNGGILNIYDKLQTMLYKSNYSILPVCKTMTDFKNFVTEQFYQLKQKNKFFLAQQCIRQIKRLYTKTMQDQQKIQDKKRQMKSQCQKQKDAKLKELKAKFEKDKQDLKKTQKDKDKIKQQQEILNKRYNGQKNSFQNQFNQQILIRGVQNEKKLNSCRDEFKNQISMMIKDKKVIENFILFRKNLSIYGDFYKSGHQNYLTQYLKEVKSSFIKSGGTIISIIYKLLSDKQNNFAELIKSQNECFKIYQKRKFKRQTQKCNLEYLLSNISEIKDNLNLITTIKQKTVVYQKKYDQLLTKYQKSSNRDQVIKQIIEQAKNNLAMHLKKYYFQNINLRENYRQHLLAHIFALRTIITAEQNQNGVIQFMYAPHPSQILSLFVLLNFVNINNINSNKLINYMIQIPTGQGKSIILGGLSAYLGLVGYQVYCACYSKYLSERDYNDFVILFYKLGLKQKIKYQTFNEICKLILNGQNNNFSQKIQEIVRQKNIRQKNIFQKIGDTVVDFFSSNQFQNIKIKADNKFNNKILLIDEADILLSQDFFGELYSPSISLRSPKIQQFTDMLWTTRKKIFSYNDILQTKQFKKLVDQYPSLKVVFQNQVYGMMYALKNPQLQKQYFVQDDKVKYKQTDGLSQFVHHGYRTMLTYYSCYQQQKIKSVENLKRMKMINLIIGHFSYALLPQYFRCILGVTGTLKQISPVQSKELKQYCNVQNKLYMPSIYGLNEKNKINFKKIKKNNLYKDIVQQITRQIQKSRPIAIFFKTEKDLYAFCDSTEFKNYKSTKFNTTIVTFQTKKQQRDRRIQRATMQNTITLFTKQFNRGTDFKNTNQTKDFEGLHVIQTYLPESISDYVQIIGRTARQGGNGSVIIYCEISQQIEVNQQEKFIKKDQGIKLITQIQNNYWEKKWKIRAQRIGNANHNHYQTIKLYTENKNDAQKVIEKIHEWNRQPIFKDRNFKTILALDGTGSMSFVFMNIKDILQESFSRLFNILTKKNLKNGFQLSVVIYRNYNSSPHLILQKSNFQTKPEPLIYFLKNVDVDGGMGNQAIQMCFNYINGLQVVDQVILIGDAQPNSPSQTKTKRNNYPNNVKDIVQTDIETQTKILLSKRIPVHSYYINAAQYFIDISKKTGGQACEFDISDRNIATQNLTNFISKKVIEKLDPRGQLLKQYIEKYEKNGVQKRYINQ